MMIGEGTKTSETKSDRFEVEIKNNLEKFLSTQEEPLKSLKVSRYEGTDTKFYSDVKITNPKNNKNIWIEIKKDKYANLGGPSFTYNDGKWTCKTIDKKNSLSQFYVDTITKGSEKFISFCKDFLKTDDITLPKDLSPELIEAWKKSGSVDDTENDVQFITDKIPLENFGEKIAEYYKTAKYDPVYYIQVGDELYIIDPEYNPLGLRTKDGHALKTLTEAYRIGRIQFRAKGIDKKLKDGNKYYYSIVCDVKILADEQKKDESEYKCSFKTEENFPIVDGMENKNKINESKSFFRRGVEFILGEYRPELDDAQYNEFGEKWSSLENDHYVNATLRSFLDDIAIDQTEEYRPDKITLKCVNKTENGVFIATFFGGCNGGGDNKNLIFYLTAIKKLAKKIVECFGSVWLLDWENVCLDDVWTLRLAFRDEKGDERDQEMIEILNSFMKIDEAEKDIGGEKSDYVPEKGVKIWIDDIRKAPSGFIWIKSVNDFIDYCYENGVKNVSLIDTDHDAGDYQKDGGDYIRCFDYLEFCGCENITVHIHSANPVGANNIRRIISKNKEKGWKEIRNNS